MSNAIINIFEELRSDITKIWALFFFGHKTEYFIGD